MQHVPPAPDWTTWQMINTTPTRTPFTTAFLPAASQSTQFAPYSSAYQPTLHSQAPHLSYPSPTVAPFQHLQQQPIPNTANTHFPPSTLYPAAFTGNPHHPPAPSMQPPLPFHQEATNPLQCFSYADPSTIFHNPTPPLRLSHPQIVMSEVPHSPSQPPPLQQPYTTPPLPANMLYSTPPISNTAHRQQQPSTTRHNRSASRSHKHRSRSTRDRRRRRSTRSRSRRSRRHRTRTKTRTHSRSSRHIRPTHNQTPNTHDQSVHQSQPSPLPPPTPLPTPQSQQSSQSPLYHHHHYHHHHYHHHLHLRNFNNSLQKHSPTAYVPLPPP